MFPMSEPRSVSGATTEAGATGPASRRTLQLLADVSAVFTEAGFDIPALLDRVTSVVSEAFEASCAVHLVEAGSDVLRLAALAHPDPVLLHELGPVLAAHPLRIGQGLSGRVVAERRAIRLHHVDPQILRRATLPASGRSSIGSR